LRIPRLIFVACALWLTALPVVHAQSTATSSQTAIVIPFENGSTAPGIEWISEAFPAVLGQRLSSPTIYVLTREDRLRAYDRAGIPAQVHPSRATIYRIAEQMDVDYVILGRFTYDGRLFTTTAQVLDMRGQKLLPAASENGPLTDLINLQAQLAWDLLKSLRPNLAVSKQAFVSAGPPMRLDAFENYIRGTLASSSADKINHLREAVRLNPQFVDAWLELGKTYYTQRQYDQAATSLAHVPATDPNARQANFYLGMSAYYQGDFAKAETAFEFVAARLPLTEVYNNLGVVTARRGKKTAAEFFQKATQADPGDPDYHFNLAVSLYRSGDLAGVLRELKQCLALRPSDAEARSFADAIAASTAKTSSSSPATAGSAAVPAPRTPLERIKRNYDEDTFQQLYVSLQAAAEQRLAESDPATHARFHIDRGQDFLTRGFVDGAEKEFREATVLAPNNAEAHAGLASALEATNQPDAARTEAQVALRLKPSAAAYLVLARLDLRDNKSESAAQNVGRALSLDPTNAAALELKSTVAAKLAQKAPPLPN
jgi:tetratricopeptide (TPR) repeat protein